MQKVVFDTNIYISALKEQIRHLIEVHPHVEDFLKMLRHHRKKVYLVTNAHYKVLDLKLKKTDLGGYFNAAITSCEIGYPKEMPEFWEKAEKQLGFEKEKTLFIDDTVAVLKTAAKYGIKYILHKTYASSKGAKGVPEDFPAIEDFRELMFLDNPEVDQP